MSSFTTEYFALIDNNYAARCCTAYEYVFVYACHVLLLLLAAAALQCVAVLLLLQLLLLAAVIVIVCRMAKFVAVVHCI